MKYYKVKSDGVSQFISCEDTYALKVAHDNFDGKIVVDESGSPKIFTEADINALMGSNANRKVDVMDIFGSASVASH